MKSDPFGKRYIILFTYYFPSFIIWCFEATLYMARGPTLLRTNQVCFFILILY